MADTTASPQHAPTQHRPTRNQLTDTMLAQVVDYYRKEYGNDSARMSIRKSDTVLELSFYTTTSDSDDYQGALFTAFISLVSDINPIISGDINGDGISDMLFTVHTEGGGGGGNIWWSDHFLFLANKSGISRLADVKSDAELMDGSGYFFPKEIANQTITGTGNGYAEDDGHCCPSLYYHMRVQLQNDSLKTVEQTQIPKPADFE